MSSAAPMDDDEDIPLYEAHKKVCPADVKGPFRRLKWAILLITLGIYYFLPFVRWDRGAYAPDQAVLVDLVSKKFYFFFIELWPQEVYFFTGLLILAALTLFLMNAVAGRLWCGYLCPQTVWTDLFLLVERWVEGDRRERMQKDAGGWTLQKLSEKLLKHSLWLLIAWWTGGAWVLYFADAPTLVSQLITFQAPMVAYIWILILTGTTYLLAGFAREQVCIYMCPWPRIQAALTDEDALNVTYRYDRGEPRGSLKDNQKRQAAGEPAGDCIDCHQCVVVCPTGVDIRKGFQLDCIQCGLCIDACDNIMEKINKPKGLIAYDNDANIQRRMHGEAEIIKPIRPRTILYAALISIIGFGMLTALLMRNFVGINALHDRNPIAVTLADGSIRNAYTVHILNKRQYPRSLILSINGLNEGSFEVVGVGRATIGESIAIPVDADSVRPVRVLITASRGLELRYSTDIRMIIKDPELNETASARDHFITKEKTR